MNKTFKYQNYNDFLYFCLNELLTLVPEELYLVGGLVREKLLGKESYDYDFIINGNALEIATKLAKKTRGAMVLLDPERDISRVVWNTDRNGFELNFDIARVAGNSLDEDLNLRDLTINSIAIKVDAKNARAIADNTFNFAKENLADPSNGYADLTNGIIRTSRKDNLINDPLRLLRVFRFAAKFDFVIEATTFNYVKELSQLIVNPAKERVLKELFDIFNSHNTAKYLSQMNETGLLWFLFKDYQKLNQDKLATAIEKISDYEKLIKSAQSIFKYHDEINQYLEQNIIYNHNKYAVLKVVILLANFKSDEESVESFSKDIEKLLKLYTFSSLEQQFILKNIRHYHEYNQIPELEINRTNLFNLFKNRKNEVIGSLLINFIEMKDEAKKEIISEIYNYFIEDKLLSIQPQIINGQDLMKELDIKPGKVIGEILAKIQQAQAEKSVSNYQEALDYSRAYLKSIS